MRFLIILLIIFLAFVVYVATQPKQKRCASSYSVPIAPVDLNIANEDILLTMCKVYIDEFELGNISHKPSCKEDLLSSIKDLLTKTRESISKLDDSEDWDRLAISMISYVSSDLLMSGKYHIYTGVLNPLNCGEQLLRVYKNSMNAAVKNGYIDTQTYKNHRDHVQDTINFVG